MPFTRFTLTAAGLTLALAAAHAADTPRPVSNPAPRAAARQRSLVATWDDINARPASGRSRSILRAPTATLDELEAHVTVLPPGQDSHPPHRHAAEEVVIVREGKVDFIINGATHHAGPGSFVLLASMEEHQARNVGDTPAVYFVMQWKTPATAAIE
jgi:XRE family transcriptional regulator, regulator of sulfur utilization